MYARVHFGGHGDPASGAEYNTRLQRSKATAIASWNETAGDHVVSLNLMNALRLASVVKDTSLRL